MKREGAWRLVDDAKVEHRLVPAAQIVLVAFVALEKVEDLAALFDSRSYAQRLV